MIAEIKIRNLLSFRDEAIFSFEADKSKDMESYHVVEVAPGVRLLKLAIVYGANASGKSNLILIYDFLRKFIFQIPTNKSAETGVVSFLLDSNSSKEPASIILTFYVQKENLDAVKYVYSLELTKTHIIMESLTYYTSQQPTSIFERTIDGGVSSIKYGYKIKLTPAAKEEISLKCLPNMSVFAAYQQVNINVPEIEDVLAYFRNQMMPAISPMKNLKQYSENKINNQVSKDYILKYLQEADFNISDISEHKQDSPEGVVRDLIFQHKVQNENGQTSVFDFPELLESQGTLRTMGLAGCIQEIISNNAILAVDEIESSLHPRLIEYIIERFLKESEYAQMLITTHYDGLLAEDDLLRMDNVWFTEKNKDGATVLYPLTDFKGLNRISSLQKAYKFGKFGAVPNI
ncbi:ATP-binding protein [uncultured Bacteroides sp.]|uniref:AAA family ATPase n=1 Tax=uncultured Bacteroides sp. TaxID=162156 RepID=UPI002AA87A8F|nr:ATP-binding protein [uncultured Bacteroides sp.]